MIDSKRLASPLDKKYWLILSSVIAYGVFARLYNLGRWELTIDEYYIVMSIESILDNGLPSFGCGGFYERGLLQQYLTAPLIAFFENTEFAARLLPALANILTIPAVYKLAAKVSQSNLIAGVVTSLFALSLWEIEFARFARMYSFFQLVFVVQLYWLVQIVIDGRIDRYKYLLATTALGVFIYQGVIFSLVLCTIPLILCTRSVKSGHLLGLMGTTLLIAIRTKIKFRSLFSEPRYPAEYVAPVSQTKLPVYVPDLMLTGSSLAGLLILAVMALLFGWVLVKCARKLECNPLQWSVHLAVLACALIHQFSLAIGLFLIATCFGIFKSQFPTHLRLLLLILIPLGLFWLLFGLSHGHGVLDTVKLMGKYPSVYWYVIGPFIQSIPRESSILFAVLTLGGGWQIVQTTRSGRASAPSLLLGLCITLALVQSALVTPEKVTRYSFFFYPALLLLFCYFSFQLARLLPLKPAMRNGVTAGLLLLFVLMSENYFPPHLLRPGAAEFNFREPYHRFLQFHFYQRYSFRDAAEFLNGQLEAGDQVIAATPGIDYYLEQLDYTYNEMGTKRFKSTSACSGTRYIWNDSTLIYSTEDLVAQVADGAGTTWIITGENGRGQSPEDALVEKHFGQHLAFTGRDGQVKVYRISAGARFPAE